jgi:hypothetical protein
MGRIGVGDRSEGARERAIWAMVASSVLYLGGAVDDAARGVGVVKDDGRAKEAVDHPVVQALGGAEHAIGRHERPDDGEDGHDADCVVCVWFMCFVHVCVCVLGGRWVFFYIVYIYVCVFCMCARAMGVRTGQQAGSPSLHSLTYSPRTR